MQLTDLVNEINEEVEETEVIKEAKPIKISWLLIQIIACALIVMSLIVLKEYFKETYESLLENYSEVIEKTILIEDGEISIVQE